LSAKAVDPATKNTAARMAVSALFFICRSPSEKK
jgi:hypothetical protein